MSAKDAVSGLALEQAGRHLGLGAVDRVEVDAVTDWDGSEVLRVRMVVKPGAAERFDGDRLLATLVGVNRAVAKSGDPRRVTLEYADEAELAAGDAD